MGQISGLRRSWYCKEHYFGLLDGVTGEKKGIGIKLYNETDDAGDHIGSGNNKITLVDTRINVTNPALPLITPNNGSAIMNPEGSSQSIWLNQVGQTETSDNMKTDRVQFILTYRRAAANSNEHTVTLQINDTTPRIDDGTISYTGGGTPNNKCLGILTYKYTGNILSATPFYAFFLSGSTPQSAPNYCPSGIHDKEPKTAGGNVTGLTILQMTDNGLAIDLENMTLNTK
jgi:hypothetical protein